MDQYLELDTDVALSKFNYKIEYRNWKMKTPDPIAAAVIIAHLFMVGNGFLETPFRFLTITG